MFDRYKYVLLVYSTAYVILYIYYLFGCNKYLLRMINTILLLFYTIYYYSHYFNIYYYSILYIINIFYTIYYYSILYIIIL